MIARSFWSLEAGAASICRVGNALGNSISGRIGRWHPESVQLLRDCTMIEHKMCHAVYLGKYCILLPCCPFSPCVRLRSESTNLDPSACSGLSTRWTRRGLAQGRGEGGITVLLSYAGRQVPDWVVSQAADLASDLSLPGVDNVSIHAMIQAAVSWHRGLEVAERTTDCFELCSDCVGKVPCWPK